MLEVVETVGRRVRGPDAPLTTSELPVTSELPRERNNAGNSVKCTKARKTTHGLDGQHQDVDMTLRGKSIRMTEDGDKWRKYVHGSRTAEEQNRSRSLD